jgi:tetratricopeptide (TPR) repeat protein
VPFVYPEVRSLLAGGVETAYQLHSLPLQLWVESGAFGLVALLLLVCGGFGVLVGRLRSLPRRPGPGLTPWEAAAQALAGYGTAALFDAQFDVPLIAWVCLSWLAFLGPAGRAADRTRTIAPRIFGGLVLAVGVSACLMLASLWHARWELAVGLSLEQRGDLAAAAGAFERSAAALPESPHALNRQALVLLRRAAGTGGSAEAATSRDAALDAFRKSLAMDPLQEPILAAYAWTRLPLDPSVSRLGFLECQRLVPDRESTLVGLALAQARLGERGPALTTLALACVASPAFALSPAWNEPPLEPYRDSVRALLPEVWPAVLARGQTQAAVARSLSAQAIVFWILGLESSSENVPPGIPPQIGEFLDAIERGQGHRTVESLSELLKAGGLPGVSPVEQAGFAERLERIGTGGGAAAFLRTELRPGSPGILRETVLRRHYGIMHRVPEDPGYPDVFPRLSDPALLRWIGPFLTCPAHERIKVAGWLESLPTEAGGESSSAR